MSECKPDADYGSLTLEEVVINHINHLFRLGTGDDWSCRTDTDTAYRSRGGNRGQCWDYQNAGTCGSVNSKLGEN